jgi:hypothetical protein
MKKKLLIIASTILVTNFCIAQINNFSSKKTEVQSAKKKKAGYWEKYLVSLIKKYKGDKVAIKKEIESLKVNFVTKKIVVCLSDGRVGGVYIDELLKAFDIVDQKVLRMSVEDFMEMDGIKKNETLLACLGGGGMSGGQHITDMIGVDMSGGTALLGGLTNNNGGITKVGVSTNGAYAALNNSQVSMANKGCMNAQITGLTAGLGMTPPTNAGYRNAVNSAISKMENGLNNCDNGINPIAEGETDTKIESNDQSSESDEEGTSLETKIKVGEVFMDLGSTTFGMFEALASGDPKVVFANGLAAVLGASGYETDSEIIEGTNTAISTISVADGFVTASAVAAGTETFALGTLGAAGTVFAVGVGAYAATKATLGNWSANAMSNTYANYADREWQKKYGNNSNKNSQPPPGEGGAKTCEDAKKAWEKFKGYCESNGWQTYECMSFVAHLNKCADPSLVNPGPEGAYTCSARNDVELIDACKKQCEAKKGISQPGNEGVNKDCGCDGLKASITFSKALSKKICETSYYPDGATPCDKIKPGNIGGNVTPVSPGGNGPTPVIKTPSKTSIPNSPSNPVQNNPSKPIKNNF